MASAIRNSSPTLRVNHSNASGLRIGIVVAEWNADVTRKLLAAARQTLTAHGVKKSNILIRRVPGSFELTFAARKVAEVASVNAVIAIGCIIEGDTPHFHYVACSVTHGITKLNLEGRVPVIFGVLITHNLQQALDRAGGKLGNKGREAAIAALRMALLA